jgi:hypothetical protein
VHHDSAAKAAAWQCMMTEHQKQQLHNEQHTQHYSAPNQIEKLGNDMLQHSPAMTADNINIQWIPLHHAM